MVLRQKVAINSGAMDSIQVGQWREESASERVTEESILFADFGWRKASWRQTDGELPTRLLLLYKRCLARL